MEMFVDKSDEWKNKDNLIFHFPFSVMNLNIFQKDSYFTLFRIITFLPTPDMKSPLADAPVL